MYRELLKNVCGQARIDGYRLIEAIIMSTISWSSMVKTCLFLIEHLIVSCDTSLWAIASYFLCLVILGYNAQVKLRGFQVHVKEQADKGCLWDVAGFSVAETADPVTLKEIQFDLSREYASQYFVRVVGWLFHAVGESIALTPP
jgi:hypothetical protein